MIDEDNKIQPLWICPACMEIYIAEVTCFKCARVARDKAPMAIRATAAFEEGVAKYGDPRNLKSPIPVSNSGEQELNKILRHLRAKNSSAAPYLTNIIARAKEADGLAAELSKEKDISQRRWSSTYSTIEKLDVATVKLNKLKTGIAAIADEAEKTERGIYTTNKTVAQVVRSLADKLLSEFGDG